MAAKVVSAYAIFENVGGTRDLVLHYEGGGSDSVTAVDAAEAEYLVGLLRNEKPVSYDAERRRLWTTEPEPIGEEEPLPDLEGWLDAHSAIARAIVWQDSAGVHPWASWSESWRAQLREAFVLARSRSSIAVPEVPRNLASLVEGREVEQILGARDAWAYFEASVAQSLAIELGQQVPWSLRAYDGPQRAQLLDSREMFTWNESPAGYRIVKAKHGRVVAAPPAYAYDFLGRGGLIGAALTTIARVVGWCHANLKHFSGDPFPAIMEDQWQYRGFPPLVRVLEGTVQTSKPSKGTAHRTAGCWGTTGFLRALLRAVNVPVELVSHGGHAQPWFMGEGAFLSHGDDPYNRRTFAEPPIPSAELLTSEADFRSWFGPGVSDADQAKNVGRRTVELAVTYLPNSLLHAYCADQASGADHASGQVFDDLSRAYTVAELEARDLWTRMDAKIAGFGGCASVPA